jgi:preprotein translocase subunit SecA
MIHYDVQLIGGIVEGKIAEMQTVKENISCNATLYLNALTGNEFTVTVNDYLA